MGFKNKNFFYPPPNLYPAPQCNSVLPQGSKKQGMWASPGREGDGRGGAELGAGLSPNINTCVEIPRKSSTPATSTRGFCWRLEGWGQAPAGCGLLHLLNLHPASLLLLIVEEMAFRVSPDSGGSLDQLPGVGVHTPALPTLPIQ